MNRNIEYTLRKLRQLQEDTAAPPQGADPAAAGGGQPAPDGQAGQQQAQQPVDMNQLTTAFQDLLKPISDKLASIEKTVQEAPAEGGGGEGGGDKSGGGDSGGSSGGSSGGDSSGGGNDQNANGGGGNEAKPAEGGNSGGNNNQQQQQQQKEALFRAIYYKSRLNS